jgi:hypothetical protein
MKQQHSCLFIKFRGRHRVHKEQKIACDFLFFVLLWAFLCDLRGKILITISPRRSQRLPRRTHKGFIINVIVIAKVLESEIFLSR